MSDEINESTNPDPTESVKPHEAESAAQAASDAAANAADAAQGDPAPTASESEALEDAVDLANQTRAQVEAATGSTTSPEATPFTLESFQDSTSGAEAGTLNLLDNVNLDVKIELGRTKMYVEDVLKLTTGAVVELDKLAGDPVDIYVNSRHVARGEVLVLNDNFCVRISEILDPNVDDQK